MADAPAALYLEMPDHVGGPDNSVIFGAGVKGVSAVRPVIAEFRADLDLRRQPVLPANGEIVVRRRGAGALSLRIVIDFGPEREVVQWIGRIVEVHDGTKRVGVAAQHGCVAAMCEARRVEVQLRERRGVGARRDVRIIDVGHAIFVFVIGLERDMPLVVPFVVIGRSVPR